VTVHDITPAGAAPPEGPVTIAVRVVVPPRVGDEEAEIVTVGTTCDIPSVKEFEVTVM
jgi:hypothetical protein